MPLGEHSPGNLNFRFEKLTRKPALHRRRPWLTRSEQWESLSVVKPRTVWH